MNKLQLSVIISLLGAGSLYWFQGDEKTVIPAPKISELKKSPVKTADTVIVNSSELAPVQQGFVSTATAPVVDTTVFQDFFPDNISSMENPDVGLAQTLVVTAPQVEEGSKALSESWAINASETFVQDDDNDAIAQSFQRSYSLTNQLPAETQEYEGVNPLTIYPTYLSVSLISSTYISTGIDTKQNQVVITDEAPEYFELPVMIVQELIAEQKYGERVVD